MKAALPPPYRGSGPYIFVCYAHDDAPHVHAEIRRLIAAGFNVWYDEGIAPGSEWSESLARHIEQCSVFLYFVSPRSVVREHCRRELSLALDQRRPVLAVHLERTEVTGAVKLSLGNRQAILRQEYSQEQFAAKLDEALNEALGGSGDVDSAADSAVARARLVPVNRPGPLLAGLLVAGVLAGLAAWSWYWGRDALVTPGDGRQPTAIAVLPLTNLSGDPQQDYFGDAIAREIWNKLTRVDGLRVISMTSSTAYRGSALDVREIGRRLGVDFIVEGSVIRSGVQARVNVRLTDAENGTDLWGIAETKPVGETHELFALYDEIAASIGKALPGRIPGLETLQQSTQPTTGSAAAYELMRQARYEFARTSDPRLSLRLAERALILDPQYVDAQCMVGAFHSLLAELGYGPPRQHYERSREAVERAIELDPRWGDAYVIRGFLYDRLGLDFPRALAAYETAEDLNADADMLTGYMQDTLLNAGLYERGIERIRASIARDPEWGGSRADLGRFLLRTGRYQEARDAFEEGLRISPENARVVFLAVTHLIVMGDLHRAQEVIDRHASGIPVLGGSSEAYLRARLAFARGDPARLERWVNGAMADRREHYERAERISNALYDLNRYPEHFRWFAIRVEERDLLGWVMDELRRRPDYWDVLNRWAGADPEEATERRGLVADHRQLVERVTRRMRL